MSKINFSTENPEIEITRAIGKKSDGKITLNTEGGSIEIDLGFASIGATTDYGGAISVGLLGQEITWGREGGTIHIGIGGFAVDVEAKDCIVTEVKSIFGHVVAQRSYPDPGCELPEPPEPPQPPEPPGLVDPIAVPVPDTGSGLVFVHCKYEGMSPLAMVSRKYLLSYQKRTILSPIEDRLQGVVARCPVDITSNYTSNHPESYDPASGTVYTKGLRLLTYRAIYYNRTESRLRTAPLTERASIYASSASTPGSNKPLFFWGAFADIKNFIKVGKEEAEREKATFPEDYGMTVYIPYVCIPYYGEIGKSKPFLPTGNKPPMNNCCEEVLDMLEDIKEAYGVDRILKDKFPISNVFMAPECDPASQTIAKNFYEILQCLFRTLAHGLIFEPRVSIKDADAAKAGDQEFKAKYLNATGWASAVAEALLEVKDDGNISTNMDVRNSFAVTQTMVGLTDAIYKLEAIIDMLGIEVVSKVRTVETPFNLQIQIGKGFGGNNERQIDLNTDEATEALLPELLKVKTNKVKTLDIHPRSRSIKEILESIEANLPSNNNG
ncbi:hypothetical protein [Microcoleus sp. D3_18a_C4]|uniref:hypothetical protein n=1 Tax=Microcoleus sp. D3_18a_C4 TaxID=3055332 RepID=UPI002FD23285